MSNIKRYLEDLEAKIEDLFEGEEIEEGLMACLIIKLDDMQKIGKYSDEELKIYLQDFRECYLQGI